MHPTTLFAGKIPLLCSTLARPLCSYRLDLFPVADFYGSCFFFVSFAKGHGTNDMSKVRGYLNGLAIGVLSEEDAARALKYGTCHTFPGRSRTLQSNTALSSIAAHFVLMLPPRVTRLRFLPAPSPHATPTRCACAYPSYHPTIHLNRAVSLPYLSSPSGKRRLTSILRIGCRLLDVQDRPCCG